MLQRNTTKKRKRPKKSIIWKLEDDKFIGLVKNSLGVGMVLNYFGLENKGRNHNTVNDRIKELKINTSHFNPLHRKKDAKYIISLNDILVKNCKYSSSTARKKIKESGILGKHCGECLCGEIWNNKKLVLQVDHINGINNDNRIENLRLLCPNCHSQTKTFAGKNNKKST